MQKAQRTLVFPLRKCQGSGKHDCISGEGIEQDMDAAWVIVGTLLSMHLPVSLAGVG